MVLDQIEVLEFKIPDKMENNIFPFLVPLSVLEDEISPTEISQFLNTSRYGIRVVVNNRAMSIGIVIMTVNSNYLWTLTIIILPYRTLFDWTLNERT